MIIEIILIIIILYLYYKPINSFDIRSICMECSSITLSRDLCSEWGDTYVICKKCAIKISRLRCCSCRDIKYETERMSKK